MPRYLGMIKILGLPWMSKANLDSNSKPWTFIDVRQNSFRDFHFPFYGKGPPNQTKQTITIRLLGTAE